jgi:hypothetical protein
VSQSRCARVVLSHPLPVFGLVGHYPTNYLIGRSPLLRRQAFVSQDQTLQVIYRSLTTPGAYAHRLSNVHSLALSLTCNTYIVADSTDNSLN